MNSIIHFFNVAFFIIAFFPLIIAILDIFKLILYFFNAFIYLLLKLQLLLCLLDLVHVPPELVLHLLQLRRALLLGHNQLSGQNLQAICLVVKTYKQLNHIA